MSKLNIIPLGNVYEPEKIKKGEVIPFQRLKDYIGKRVLSELKVGSEDYCQIIEIKDYVAWEEMKHDRKTDNVVPGDMIYYTDGHNIVKSGGQLYESICTNGRFKVDTCCPVCIYDFDVA